MSQIFIVATKQEGYRTGFAYRKKTYSGEWEVPGRRESEVRGQEAGDSTQDLGVRRQWQEIGGQRDGAAI